MMPAQIAAEDEPRPRPCGIRLTQCTRSPGGWPPRRSNAARRDLTTRCVSSQGTDPAPSPSTVTSSPDPVTSTVTSSRSSSASPNASKPGPRLALVAGGRTV